MSRRLIGAVLAGGEGRRMGGGKPARMLGGRPLVSYPVEALAAVCGRVAVIAKPDSELPDFPAEAERWDEPDGARHPLAGLIHALERAGEPVFVCAADMPFVTPDACRTLLGAASAGSAPAAVAMARGITQPLLGIYAPVALESLREAPADGRLTDAVETLRPVRVALPAAVVRSVDTPEELAAAERELASRPALVKPAA